MLRYAPLCLLLAACSDRPPTTPETRPVENPNAGNTAIYDVDPDDPYEIDDGSFLDISPGQTLSESDFLLPGEGAQRYLSGRRGDTLGYVLLDGDIVTEVHVTSPDVVTKDGLRVGNTLAEVMERRGKLDTEGRTVVGEPSASNVRVCFELAPAGTTATPMDAPVREIVLRR